MVVTTRRASAAAADLKAAVAKETKTQVKKRVPKKVSFRDAKEGGSRVESRWCSPPDLAPNSPP